MACGGKGEAIERGRGKEMVRGGLDTLPRRQATRT